VTVLSEDDGTQGLYFNAPVIVFDWQKRFAQNQHGDLRA
jgi:hypothetical protein